MSAAHETSDRRATPARPAAAGASVTGPASLPADGVAVATGASSPLLRSCGLASCCLAEAAPLDFRVCALCNAVAYCCETHSAAHWRAGHKRECVGRTRAAAQYADSAGSASAPSVGAAAGGGAASGPPSTGAVVHPPLQPPSREDVAALRALVEKWAEKAALRRHGRAAEVAGQAADLAVRMYGADGLVGAYMRFHESVELGNASLLEASNRDSLVASSWTALLGALAVAARRQAARTLLPGACRAEEVAYAAQALMATVAPWGMAAPSNNKLRAIAASVGYDLLLEVAHQALNHLRKRSWPAPGRLSAQDFVIAALDTIRATAGLLDHPSAGVIKLVGFFSRNLGECGCLEPGFYAAVVAKWASPAVVDVLRAQGALGHAAASFQQVIHVQEARRVADVAARGFRRCGLPACGRLETTVRHFKLCTGCDAVAYCCDEHHDTHWNEGHRRECRHLRAAGAKPPSTLDG